MMHSISMVISYLELFINDKDLMDDLKKIFYNDSVDIRYFDEILKKHFRVKEFIKTKEVVWKIIELIQIRNMLIS